MDAGFVEVWRVAFISRSTPSLIKGRFLAVPSRSLPAGCIGRGVVGRVPGNLVGAAGFEPTTPLVFIQGALTAELHAYVLPRQIEGIHRITLGPRTFVQPNGSRRQAATGN